MKPIALASPEGLLKCRITAPTPNRLNLHINKICQVMGAQHGMKTLTDIICAQVPSSGTHSRAQTN